MSRRTEAVTFEGHRGTPLAGRLEYPAAGTAHWAVLAHCFTCGKDLKGLAWLARVLVEHGWGVLRFDFTGIGQSQGEFAETGLTSNVEDLEAAERFLRRTRHPPVLMVGHSLGGAATLLAANRLPEVRAVATLAAPSSLEHLHRKLVKQSPRLEREERAEMSIGGRTVTIGPRLLADLTRENVVGAVGALQRPLLVLHSPADTVVDIRHAGRLFQAAHHPRSFVSLHDADHLLSNRADARWTGHVLAAWAQRWRDSR